VSTAIVAGALANKPGNGGEAWVRLSWVLGLQRLGFDVWLLEQIAPEICVDTSGRPASIEGSANLAWFARVVARVGLAERAALVDPGGKSHFGPSDDELCELAARAELLLNISGNLTAEPLLGAPHRRAYLDLDPGYTQIWNRTGLLAAALARHEHLLTVALAIGAPSCMIPTDGLRWRPVSPPVVLAEWPTMPKPDDARVTTVASWRGGYGRLESEGHTYGQKAHEFRRLASLPQHTTATLELALEIDTADEQDAILLRDGGWALVDPKRAAADPDGFRSYVQGSAAELSPAQGVYVETRSGWFSDRTTRYLASGRPAVVQDTGLGDEIPRGAGLLTFRTPEEAASGIDTVLSDYERHARAARELAEELFDSDIVIADVLEDILS
jgi:hypothetical protein